jgi:hypothetical protein
LLNAILAQEGFSIPITQADAKLVVDEFAVSRAAMYTDAVGRMSGSRWGEGSKGAGKSPTFENLWQDAVVFVKTYAQGLEELGATRSFSPSRGLYAGGISIDDKDDIEDDSDRAKPSFWRGMFQHAETSQAENLDDEAYPANG